MTIAAKLREMLQRTIEYEKERGPFDAKLEALLPVIRKEIPLKAHVHRADDIFTAIRIAKEFDVKLTLDHCTEGHLIAEELAKEGYSIAVGPSFGHASKKELEQKTFETPAILANAGCKVADHHGLPGGTGAVSDAICGNGDQGRHDRASGITGDHASCGGAYRSG